MLASGQECGNIECGKHDKGVKAKVNKKIGNKGTKKNIDPDAMLKVIDQLVNNGGVNAGNKGDIASALLNALGDNVEENNTMETEKETAQDKTIKLLETIKRCVSGSNSPNKSRKRTGNNAVEGGKKLVSGKCAKPDETDIKMVVKYAHKKLDSRHVKEKTFDKLQFNTLIAGELELAEGHCGTEEERSARIQIAKMLCYHQKYLEDEELQEGYNTILKKVEQGKLKWCDNLGDRLHEHLDYRANVNMRNKMSLQETVGKADKKNQGEKRATEIKNNGEKVVYCLKYNLGTCLQADHHDGRFAGKKVTKFHICRKCHREGDFKSHKDSDQSCPKKYL